MGNKNINKQLRYLSQSALLEESVYPRLMIFTILLVSVSLLAIIAWASVSTISEVSDSPGEVVPSKYIQLVQHLEGGIISKINVKEGEIVKKDQVLVVLDGLDFKKDLARLKSRQLTLQLQAERLKAYIQDREPNFDKISGVSEKLKDYHMKIFLSDRNSKNTTKEIIKNQIAQKRESLNILKDKKNTLQDNINIAKEELKMKDSLLEKGLISKVSYFEIKKQFNTLKGKINELESQTSRDKEAILEFESRLISLKAEYQKDAYKQLEDIGAQFSQNKESIDKLTDKVERLYIRSPANGLVKKIALNTIGGVISPGQPVMDIVPFDDQLIVESRIDPSDIGHIKKGYEADIKFSSYDFSRYGTVKGTLNYISATTFTKNNGDKYYLGRILLSKNFVGNNPEENPIVPGMTVKASIITGKKTILSYLLKPIQSSIDGALSER
ncbi:HlyD family type I secretion periplasmic adaptor subunit [Rickettsiales bacterium]|nr:HlyD family type I secretion periplasmic adaptor subunit [Rickettsiales bacterium]